MTPGLLRLLFSALRDVGYEWQPQTPDRLLSMRKNPEPFRPLVRWLGLGLPESADSLEHDDLPGGLFKLLVEARFAVPTDEFYRSEMAVSGSGDLFVVHDHWPPDLLRAGGYVHYAAESHWLARTCSRDLEGFIDKRVLDLGSGSGALAFEVGGVAREVLGLDIASRAVEWSRLAAAANGLKNLRFEVATVGELSAEDAVGDKPWDMAVMNPPMVVPSKDAAYPHRDGGRLGIELPLKFLEFTHQHLVEGGEVLTFATNPIVGGKGLFFEELPRGAWDVIEKRCVHSHFNQAVARKQGYADQGIERIELWFLNLRRI